MTGGMEYRIHGEKQAGGDQVFTGAQTKPY